MPRIDTHTQAAGLLFRLPHAKRWVFISHAKSFETSFRRRWQTAHAMLQFNHTTMLPHSALWGTQQINKPLPLPPAPCFCAALPIAWASEGVKVLGTKVFNYAFPKRQIERERALEVKRTNGGGDLWKSFATPPKRC